MSEWNFLVQTPFVCGVHAFLLLSVRIGSFSWQLHTERSFVHTARPLAGVSAPRIGRHKERASKSKGERLLLFASTAVRVCLCVQCRNNRNCWPEASLPLSALAIVRKATGLIPHDIMRPCPACADHGQK